MEIPSHASYNLPCCVEGSVDYIPKAQYALQMLLMPLGINPVWGGRASLVNGGIYYGANNARLSQQVVSILLKADTCRYFEEKKLYKTDRVSWRKHGNDRYPVLFGGPALENDDLIASTFYWLSGWQEYTISNRDQHGRFPYAASLQAGLESIYEPVVDVYREVLKRQLLQQSIPVKHRTWGGQSWAFCPTHDIDYLRKWRPGMVYREVVERFITNSADKSGAERVARLGQFLKDAIKPGDIFRKAFVRMIDEVQERGGKATYFIKAGAHGPHDVYYAPSNAFLRHTLNRLKAQSFEVGLHPSYYAHTHPGYLAKEKQQLESVTGCPVTSVRQHYLRYEMPQTLNQQVDAGFQIDSTLAFADHEGFRNATCHPFLRYNILNNKSTTSWEMPLCFMDGTLFNYRGLDVESASHVSEKLIQSCKKYRGVCVGLWHNTLWDEMDFAGWGAHFVRTLDYARGEGGRIDSLRGALDEYLGG